MALNSIKLVMEGFRQWMGKGLNNGGERKEMSQYGTQRRYVEDTSSNVGGSGGVKMTC
jgi:hypothetical protein